MSLSPVSYETMINGLKSIAAFSHSAEDIQHIQTHISHVILAGEFAYKIKKPLDLGFLDFSTLERRKFFCEEELRLNHRLAPSVYLEVVPITGTPEQPKFGGDGSALEYAVKMQRFPQSALLSGRQIDASLVACIATAAAEFHSTIPSEPAGSGYGDPETVFFPMQQNFDQIRDLVKDADELKRLDVLEAWTQAEYKRLQDTLAQRQKSGCIKECHGDMHLGNIALIDNEITIFDGIEFNPNFRWIDTMSEVAFFIMDLQQAGKNELAQCFLDRYLQATGDYNGLSVLRLYQAYRALVRAKVTAIRLAQGDLPADEKATVMAEYARYRVLAENYMQESPAAVIITCGLSGSGKSRLSNYLLEKLPAIRIRSDVERKRLFGLASDANSQSELGDNIYSSEASQATYAHLQTLTQSLVAAGYSTIVDATFIKQDQRQGFFDLADKLQCEYIILDFQVPEAVLRERVMRRSTKNKNVSEADIQVLEYQLKNQQPLTVIEQKVACTLDTSQDEAWKVALAYCRERLQS